MTGLDYWQQEAARIERHIQSAPIAVLFGYAERLEEIKQRAQSTSKDSRVPMRQVRLKAAELSAAVAVELARRGESVAALS